MIAITQTVIGVDGQVREISRRGVEIGHERSFLGCSMAEWRGVLMRAWRTAGRYWFRVILPRHFTHAGAAEYGYQGRHPTYVHRKFKKFGHTYPLIWSGELFRTIKWAEDVRSDPKGAKVVLHGPKHLWAYRKDYRQPDKAAELSAVSARDAEELAGVIGRQIEQLKGAGAGTRTSIYGGHTIEGGAFAAQEAAAEAGKAAYGVPLGEAAG